MAENNRHNDTRVSLPIPLEGGENTVRISVYHDKGGMNYFNYKREPAGYWASVGVSTVETREGSGFECERIALGGRDEYGRRFYLARGDRFNAKKLEALAARIHAEDAKIAALVVVKDHDAIRAIFQSAAAGVFGDQAVAA